MIWVKYYHRGRGNGTIGESVEVKASINAMSGGGLFELISIKNLTSSWPLVKVIFRRIRKEYC